MGTHQPPRPKAPVAAPAPAAAEAPSLLAILVHKKVLTAEQAEKVKRTHHRVITAPYSIAPGAALSEPRTLMSRSSAFVVRNFGPREQCAKFLHGIIA